MNTDTPATMRDIRSVRDDLAAAIERIRYLEDMVNALLKQLNTR